MQVDPQLQKLTALIEQKRAAQVSASQRPVGKPGNPKFAEAARRVQLAQEGQTQPVSAVKVQKTDSSSAAKSASRVLLSGQDRLTKVRPFGHLYNTATAEPPKGESAPHLGRNFDSYA